MIDREEFNALPIEAAADRLASCFADARWARSVAARRPFAALTDLFAAADSAWFELTEADWLHVLATHPRIGERGGHAPAASEREQSGVRQAPAQTLADLAAENRAYEERFGHVFLIAAAGRGADEILTELRRRLDNQPDIELAEAAEELRRITRMRLERMLNG